MTYEQAGHGRAGLGINTDEGYELTLTDRVAHHFTTGISTLEIAAENQERLVEEFKKFFDNSDARTKTFALRGNPDKLAALTRLLDRHEIRYGSTSARIRGYNYQQGNQTGFQAGETSLIIPTNQPKGRMVEVLFEPSTTLVDSLTYDITAWSLPYAYGLEAVSSSQSIAFEANQQPIGIHNTINPQGAGYLAKWDSMDDARFLAALLKEDFKVRFTERGLQTQGQIFEPGSLIITKSDNKHLEDFDNHLMVIANQHQRQLTPALTGFASSGPDFGSPSVKIINKPRVAVLRGDGISSLNYGEIWYFFEQELGYPVTSLDSNYFSPNHLEDFDVLILPSGRYGSLFEARRLPELQQWIRRGGKVIALSAAVQVFGNHDSFSLKHNTSKPEEDTLKVSDLIPYADRERENIKNLITGSIVKTHLDSTHPMAFGYHNSYYSMKLGSDSYSLLKEGSNVGYLGPEPEIVAGFAGTEARKKLVIP